MLNVLPWRRPRAATSAGTTQTRIAIVEGDGRCGMKVSGTSYHQPELEILAGGRSSESAHHKCAALLLPEPDNAYDPNAVAVYIVANGAKTGIGYLQHDIAPLFNRRLLADEFSAAACNALIVGGWHNNSSEDGSFGLRLDACLPFRMQPLALPDAAHDAPAGSQPNQIGARPPPKVLTQRYRFAILTIVFWSPVHFLLYISLENSD
jgi:hypothetical protein